MINQHNINLFQQISIIDDQLLKLDLNNNEFTNSYQQLRKLTSQIRTFNNENYPAVFFPESKLAGIEINFQNTKINLIMDLQFYYVYGFFIAETGKIIAFSGEAANSITKADFTEINILPFSDSYSSILHYALQNGKTDPQDLPISKENISNAFLNLANNINSLANYTPDILIFLWSFIEGVRFSIICNHTYLVLYQNHASNKNFSYYLNLARNWANLSVAAAKAGILLNDIIAVYDLNRLHQHNHTNE